MSAESDLIRLTAAYLQARSEWFDAIEASNRDIEENPIGSVNREIERRLTNCTGVMGDTGRATIEAAHKLARKRRIDPTTGPIAIEHQTGLVVVTRDDFDKETILVAVPFDRIVRLA